MNDIKAKIKGTGIGGWLLKKGLFSKSKWKIIIVNFIFQRTFRLNSDSPWSVHFTSIVIQPKNIKVDESSLRSFMRSPGCYVQAINGIEIGKNVWWGPGVGIVSANKDTASNLVGHVPVKPIKLGDNVWIGMNSVLLPGVELGENVVVGAGSVVTKSFPKDVVVAGNPARIIRGITK